MWRPWVSFKPPASVAWWTCIADSGRVGFSDIVRGDGTLSDGTMYRLGSRNPAPAPMAPASQQGVFSLEQGVWTPGAGCSAHQLSFPSPGPAFFPRSFLRVPMGSAQPELWDLGCTRRL